MFNFLNMMGNYEDRCIDCYDIEESDVFISTAEVTDGKCFYETAVAHPEYNDGELIIVEAYDIKEQAQNGHNKWVELMTGDNLPDSLKDCGNAELSSFIEDSFGEGHMLFYRENKEESVNSKNNEETPWPPINLT